MVRLHDLLDNVNNFSSDHQPIIHDYTYSLPLVTVVLYLLFVKYGPVFMKDREKRGEKFLWLWNLFLCVFSFVMFLGMALPVVSFTLQRGMFELVCLPGRELYTGSQFFWVYLFALSKYLELLDTVFIVLRKRPITFLHYYHHTTVLLFTWFSMVTLPGGNGYVFSIMNSAVHTLMYWYYYRSAIGKRPSWGQLVTVIQLSQMVVGVIFSLLWCYYFFSSARCTCDYPYVYIIYSLALYGSYFILFLQFYINRYIETRKAKKVN